MSLRVLLLYNDEPGIQNEMTVVILRMGDSSRLHQDCRGCGVDLHKPVSSRLRQSPEISSECIASIIH
jgi:hypothetical protein